ncbi:MULTISPECIES: SPOR domain-containing protein [unclassified Asaia]|uniref:SPOR domain-containing protein n=1 Tax=unclassified Asaia TaxID=2685023 RepID=UPI0018F49AA4|nr:SPOR domain-containing protein [Asaia sp. W19]
MQSLKALAFAILGGTGLTLAGCHHDAPPQKSVPHYVIGTAWQGTETWFYPSEHFDLSETGLAVIQAQPRGGLTADGEVWSAQSMTGAHQTLQLPSVVSVRNLTNGRIVRIRLNDRGPSSSGRMLAVTPRVATLLGMGSAPTPVEIVQDEALSRQIAESNPNAPKLEIAAAPREAIVAQSLDDGSTKTLGLKPTEASTGTNALYVPDMPQTVMQGQPDYVAYHVVLGSFSGHAAASRVAAQCGADIVAQAGVSNGLPWLVSLGPFTTVPEADRALAQARQCGGTGAHIVAK